MGERNCVVCPNYVPTFSPKLNGHRCASGGCPPIKVQQKPCGMSEGVFTCVEGGNVDEVQNR